ncbi:MAG: M28 family peptidase, partial [Acidobacteriota bacterium]
LDLAGEEVTVRNLVASMGEGQVILLGAHYDTRLRADQDADPQRRSDPVLGANDGGSGTGVLLELARIIAQHHPPRPGIEIRLLFFDAEDNGNIPPWNTVPSAGGRGWIIGSSLYAQGLDLDEENIRFMILVDMVGDSNQRFPQEGYSRESAPLLTQALWDLAGELGFREHFPLQLRGRIIDDHLPFVLRGIPSADIIDLDYPEWHTSQDALDKVSAESLQRVGRLLEEYLIQIEAVRGRRGLRDRPDSPVRPKKQE